MADLPDWRAPQHLAVSAPMPRQSYPSRNLAGQAPKDAPDQALPDARPPAWKAECAETQPPEAAHRLSNGGGSVSACAFLTDCRPHHHRSSAAPMPCAPAPPLPRSVEASLAPAPDAPSEPRRSGNAAPLPASVLVLALLQNSWATPTLCFVCLRDRRNRHNGFLTFLSKSDSFIKHEHMIQFRHWPNPPPEPHK